MKIVISKDFSETPGARNRSDGPDSGQQFREEILEPKFLEAKEKNEKLEINLDGGYGYPTSFLEEAFGGLARLHGAEIVERILTFISDDEPPLINEILSYIRDTKVVHHK